MAYRVLLVTPHHQTGLDIERMLLDSGYVTRFVTSFQDAVSVLAQEPPDVLVSALRLGPFNGCHLLLRARALTPGVHGVLFGTPADHSEDVRQLGIPMIHVPIARETLLASVAECLRGRPMREELPLLARKSTALSIRTLAPAVNAY